MRNLWTQERDPREGSPEREDEHLRTFSPGGNCLKVMVERQITYMVSGWRDKIWSSETTKEGRFQQTPQTFSWDPNEHTDYE